MNDRVALYTARHCVQFISSYIMSAINKLNEDGAMAMQYMNESKLKKETTTDDDDTQMKAGK